MMSNDETTDSMSNNLVEGGKVKDGLVLRLAGPKTVLVDF